MIFLRHLSVSFFALAMAIGVDVVDATGRNSVKNEDAKQMDNRGLHSSSLSGGSKKAKKESTATTPDATTKKVSKKNPFTVKGDKEATKGVKTMSTEKSQLRVMTYNIWGGGTNEGKPIDETLAVLRAADADIIGIQETRPEASICDPDNCLSQGESVAGAIAAELGYYFYDQTAQNVAMYSNAVISRFPILFSTQNDIGVAIELGDGKIVFAFNVHFTDFPYQPYQLLDIEYGPAPFLDTEEEAIEAANEARGPAVELLFADLIEAVDEDDVVFIFGDFNEPSFRDSTTRAVEAGQQPIKVEFPTTKKIEDMGFLDALREAYPDEVAKPAFTWTPITELDDPEDHHNRIDFVYVRGKDVRVLDAAIVGEKSPEADIVVTPYPSDHRAVVATVEY